MLQPIDHIVWNIFLALIPVALAWAIAFAIDQKQKRLEKVVLLHWLPVLLFWFAFLPNSCYLLTEWRHFFVALIAHPSFFLDARHNYAQMYLFLSFTGFYVVYSGIGLLSFFLAIYPIDRLFKIPIAVKAVFFYLCAFGVYLGLIPRYNSWNFMNGLTGIFKTSTVALVNLPLLVLVIGFAALLWALYEGFYLMMEGAQHRIAMKRNRQSDSSVADLKEEPRN
jgi:uncharacterized membrane protein